jgi:predicted secreted protein
LCHRIRPVSAVLWLFIVLLLVPAAVEAQTVTLQGRVSEAVTLSISPHTIQDSVDVGVVNSGGAVRMTLSGKNAKSAVIRVPLIVRSNTNFKISGIFESNTAQLAQLSVIDVRATGRLVSPEAVNNLEIPSHFDRRGLMKNDSPEDFSSPFFVLSGPRVSLGGTLESSNNALQITLLIRLESQSVGSWLAHLTFFHD